MLTHLIVFLINMIRRVRNLWRRMLGRRVDYVKITLRGGLPEFAPPVPWWRKRFLGASEPLSLSGLRRQLQQIGDDPHTRGVLLEINGFAAGSATLQSLRDDLLRFRAGGKVVIAYLFSADNAGYYTACAADQILMPPSASFGVLGLHYEAQYLRDALAKFGIEAEVEAVSPYKSAYERFTRTGMSPENREQLEQLLDVRYAELVRVIAEGRRKDTAAVQALIDRAPLNGAEALEAGLVDALCYEDQLPARFKQGEREPVIQEWAQARRSLQLSMARVHPKLVGVVPVQGAIVAGPSRNLPLPLPLLGGEQAGADTVIQALRTAERNRRIAAVVLYVNSPGGDAFASDLIWREVLRLQKQKPVVVVMGDVAASGGYYIAAPAATIIARESTVTGSIGVISLRPVLAGLLEKADIQTTVLRRGANSGLMATSQPLSDSERNAWQRQVATFYAQFKQRVYEGRGLSEGQLEPIAGGRVWPGSQARTIGLIDEFGGLPTGVRVAQELAELPLDERAPLVLLRGGRTRQPPQPFPTGSIAELIATVEDALQPRVWALLPYTGLE